MVAKKITKNTTSKVHKTKKTVNKQEKVKEKWKVALGKLRHFPNLVTADWKIFL